MDSGREGPTMPRQPFCRVACGTRLGSPTAKCDDIGGGVLCVCHSLGLTGVFYHLKTIAENFDRDGQSRSDF